jgi:PAS domain S-box-containing protein
MRALSKLGPAALIALSAVWFSSSLARAQQSVKPKRVLVLYWDEKEHPANVAFESQFQAALRSAAPGPIEFYAEFLESNRFPDAGQSEFLHDYMKRKYAGRRMDVIVPTATATLDFLFKYRTDLFPQTPIVFAATQFPSAAQLKSGAGATGIIYVNSYQDTVDLALKLQTDTEQVFVVSGTPAHDKAFEKMARRQLDGYPGKAAITYLTDLPLEELVARIKTLPKRSIVLYVWNWAWSNQGQRLESQDVLRLIAGVARVPIYGMSFANVGNGIVGGYVWTMEAQTGTLAQKVLEVAYGAQVSHMPVESVPVTPMFDWRELQRWGIPEDRLPRDSVIRFRELTRWQQFKWRILATIAIIVLQAALICLLIIEARRARQNASALGRAQRGLRESEERFRNMANTAPVKIVITDANRQATFFNKTWLEFTGRTTEQELGLGWTAGVHPDDRDECLAKLWASHEARVEFELEYRLRRADGQYRSVICRGVPRFEPDKTFTGFIESMTDVTLFKQALANQKLESLGVLASGIAHDFNNLLGSILSSSELMLSDPAAAAPVREGLEKIKVIAMRASQIVRQLMVYAGEESAVFEELDLAELVREMLQLMMVYATKNAVLKIDVPANVPPIRGNAAQVRQVVINLITNASDALSEKGGTISVTLTQVPSLKEWVLGESAVTLVGDFLRLEVRDSGCGMTNEIQGRIFDPFFSTKRAGRGMGLAAVRGIIQSHGGTIKVESAVGSGSCFQVLLPCVGETEPKSRKDVVSAPSNAGENVTATVLFIDDEDSLRLPIARMLRQKGFSILETGDGAAAVDLFQAHVADIDIVLLDLTLPGMFGGEILTELRKIRSDIKVVLSTAYGRERAFAGVSDPNSVSYLRKPYEIEELTALLRKVCLDKLTQATVR